MGTGASKRDHERLTGRVVVVRAIEADVARALSADGAALVLLAIPHEDDDAARAGALAREIVDAGGRAVVFVGDASDEAGRATLAEMISELFPEAR